MNSELQNHIINYPKGTKYEWYMKFCARHSPVVKQNVTSTLN